ncbi:MAG: response regulator transcription factor [Casimicrobium sp.]|jgi:two-component system invasion response regulator UvrY
MIKIKIGLVDDHAILRKGIRAFLEEDSEFEVVAEGASGRDAIDMVRDHELDVLLMDISMPGQSGLEALAMLRAKAPDVGIIILSSYAEEQYAVSLIRQGASGYLNKQCDPDNIIAAIRRVASGHRFITPEVSELLAQQLNRPEAGAPHERLSDREMQVFTRLAKGDKVTDIGDALSLSVKTVSTYRTRIMEKMGLSSNSDLTYYALKTKLID